MMNECVASEIAMGSRSPTTKAAISLDRSGTALANPGGAFGDGYVGSQSAFPAQTVAEAEGGRKFP